MTVQGRNVIIEQSYGPPKITKDGVTVAKAIEFKNRFENLGANLIKQVASATNDVAGDGERWQRMHTTISRPVHWTDMPWMPPPMFAQGCWRILTSTRLPKWRRQLTKLHCTRNTYSRTYRSVHFKTGTTTATVLARAIYDESCKSAAAGIAPQDMRKGVQMGVDHVVARLKERAKMISTPEEIAQVLAESLGASVLP